MKVLFKIAGLHGNKPVQISWQTGSGNYIATAGETQSVFIHDRHGAQVEEITLSGKCDCLAWDREGDTLAITTVKSNVLLLWVSSAGKVVEIDSGFSARDSLCAATWSNSTGLLAVGSSKGNLLLFNHRTSRKVPVVGKHTKKITGGAFSEKDVLALTSEDLGITVSNAEGDTTYNFGCEQEPSLVKWAPEEGDRAGREPTLSAVIGKKSLMLIDLNDADNPMNLQFQEKYGGIVTYQWYNGSYVLLGFTEGWIVAISTNIADIGQEVFSVQEYKSALTGIAINNACGQAITTGHNTLKIRETSNLTELHAIVNVDDAELGLGDVKVTEDGQLVAASTANGTVWVFLTRLPTVGAAHRTRVAVLSSLSEISVVNEIEQIIFPYPPILFNVDVEPSMLALGPFHCAAGMNNRAWFYRIGFDAAEKVSEKEYLSTIKSLHVNTDYACALIDGRVQLHAIEQDVHETEDKLFPEQGRHDQKVTAAALTPDFLIYATNKGQIVYYYIDEGKTVSEYKHSAGITLLAAEHAGTRLVFLDERQEGHLYNPVNDSITSVPECHGGIKQILWENYPFDRDIFVTYDGTTAITYAYYRDTIEGPKVKQVLKTKIVGQNPLMLHNGMLTCQASSGRTVTVALDFADVPTSKLSPSEMDVQATKFIALKKWMHAWAVCDQLASEDHWQSLGSVALYHMDVDFASRVFRQCHEVGLVQSLESVLDEDDRSIQAGHVGVLLGQFDLAESLYLDSPKPTLALQMRRDLLHWSRALDLASKYAPSDIPMISKEYAQQLEFTGNYSDALEHYEKGLQSEVDNPALKDACRAGIARMSIRNGQIRRGMEMAEGSMNRQLKRDCAQILEQLKQFAEAGQLYESAELIDRAAGMYARAKNWLKVGELLPKVNSPKIHMQYARAMESQRKYAVAAAAYRTAKDYDNVVRLMLNNLNEVNEAVQIVRESRSAAAAKLVANHFLKSNDYGAAIDFLVLSRCGEEAFKLAERHDRMEIFADVLANDGTANDYDRIAQYFESKRNYKLAGKFYYMCGRYAKALDHLISNGEDHESLKLAVECVGKAKDPDLTRKFVDFLMGEIDGIPKDAKYLFRLYMALKMYKEASKVAIIIAREDQNAGQYRTARDVLLSMYLELRKQNIGIPRDMSSSLMLIHTYLLAKVHIKFGDHLAAARLLSRVSTNISKFPAHTVPILTSTVIECQRSGLKSSAFRFAAMLMRPEHRSKVDQKYQKKIEGIVRKPDKAEKDPIRKPCPCCSEPLAEYELTCTKCKNDVPYCIASGKHVTANDLTTCPACEFPAIITDLKRVLTSGEPKCPLCGSAIDKDTIKSAEIENVMKAFQAMSNDKENIKP